MNLEQLIIPTAGKIHLSWAALAILLLSYVTLRGFLVQGSLYLWMRASEFAKSKRVFKIDYSPAQLRSELQSSLITVCIDSVLFATLIYHQPHQTNPGNLGMTFLISFIWFEIWFYATHRLFHTKALFFIHKQHHVAKVTSPLTAMSFSVLERLILVSGGMGGLMIFSSWIPLANLGVALYLTINYFLNLLAHLNIEIIPPRILNFSIGRALNTPTYHALHHARNKGHYGLFTPCLDWIFDTRFSDYRQIQEMAYNKNGLAHLGARFSAPQQ